jgi:hypothetical protein
MTEQNACQDGNHTFQPPVRAGSVCVCGSIQVEGTDTTEGTVIAGVHAEPGRGDAECDVGP